MILIYVTSELIQAWSKNLLNIRPNKNAECSNKKHFAQKIHRAIDVTKKLGYFTSWCVIRLKKGRQKMETRENAN